MTACDIETRKPYPDTPMGKRTSHCFRHDHTWVEEGPLSMRCPKAKMRRTAQRIRLRAALEKGKLLFQDDIVDVYIDDLLPIVLDWAEDEERLAALKTP